MSTPFDMASFDMNRRGLIQSIGLLIGATALPVEALAVPRRRRRGAAATHFLSPAQYTLLIAVADTILPASDSPGAVAAQVPQRLDSLLTNWAAPETRTLITSALSRIDAAARASKQRGFAALPAADRAAVLRPHDAAALRVVPPPPGAAPANFFSARVSVADQGYYRLKDLVVDLYYFSEVANTRELTYIHVPGAFQPSITLTPQSRPFLGTGPF
jgi:hypothetical protein